MEHEDNLKAGIALLKKIPLNMLTEDAQALFTKGIEMIEVWAAEGESGMTEDQKQDAIIAMKEAEQYAEVDPREEGGTLHAEDAHSTVDDQMEADLEEATKKALEEE